MKKLNQFGYTKVEVLIIIVLLGIVAFITINKTSYAFAIDHTKDIETFKNLIEIQAEDYAMEHLDLFVESNTTFISVNDLIDSGYLITNDNGLVTNPVDTDKNYNDHKIKLEYNKDKNEVIATLAD